MQLSDRCARLSKSLVRARRESSRRALERSTLDACFDRSVVLDRATVVVGARFVSRFPVPSVQFVVSTDISDLQDRV